MSSPKNPCTRLSLESAGPVDPIERTAYGFLPRGIELRAPRLRHRGMPAPLDAPVAHELGAVCPITHREPGRVCGPERRGLGDARPHDGNAELVGLKLHQELVRDHAAVDAQLLDRDAGVLLHGL